MVQLLILAALVYIYYKTVMFLTVKKYSLHIIIVILVSSLIISPIGMYLIALIIPPANEK